MLSRDQSLAAIQKVFPGEDIEHIAFLKGVHVFKVEVGEEFEQGYDPFFAVDVRNGQVSEFSIPGDATPAEIMKARGGV